MRTPSDDTKDRREGDRVVPGPARARFALTAGALFAVWLALSGKFQLQYLSIGAIGALLIAASLFPRDGRRPFPVWRFVSFLPWLMKEIVVSNLRVARTAVSPRAAIAPRFVRVAPSLRDPRALTVLGCAITLTPGTLTLDVTTEDLHVHALDGDSARDIEARVIEKRVERMFRA